MPLHQLAATRSTRSKLTALAIAAVVVSGGAALFSGQAAADDWLNRPGTGVIQVVGHGEGHGRGMSQYGAQGAAGIGLTSPQILDFYYPSTQQGSVDPGRSFRVWISADVDGETEVVRSDSLEVTDAATGQVISTPTTADRVKANFANGKFTVQYRSAGMWATASGNLSGPINFRDTRTDVVELVLPNGDRIGYQSLLQAFRDSDSGVTRTINDLPLDAYVKGVVPRESISSWLPAALQSQAVAARTFAAVSITTPRKRGVYNICDTAACQVYGGATLNGRSRLTPNTSNAVEMTAGLIRTYNGMPINAQFGSTNGGHSTAGTAEPYLVARPDPYEALAKPPQKYANWTSTISVSVLESRWPEIGNFERIRITQRTGGGDWGGPVVKAVIQGSKATKEITGDQLRQTVAGTIRSAFLQISDSDTSTLPSGAVDVVAVTGALHVRGWAFDPDAVATSLVVHVYDTGPDGSVVGSVVTADQRRADVGAAYPGVGDSHGFDVWLPTSGRGLHSVCVYAINIGFGTGNPSLGCRSVMVGGPFGVVDAVTSGDGSISVSGWAVDPASSNAPTPIHIYDTGPAGVVGYSGFTTGGSRPDVAAAYPGVSAGSGYSAVVPGGASGVHTVCAFAISSGPGGNTQLGCQTVTVRNPLPSGAVDVVAVTGALHVRGWAFDPDAVATSLVVHVYDTGPDGSVVGSVVTADQRRADVGAAYPGVGDSHGFDVWLPTSGRGLHSVCVYAINIGFGTGNPSLGCRSVMVGGPFGVVDAVTSGDGSISVSGWAVDPASSNVPTPIHIYDTGPAGVVGYSGFTTGGSRPDVAAAYPGVSAGSGYSAVVPGGASGVHTVCAFAISSGPGGNTQLGCQTVEVR
ncbi:SpoIID/LytB domain-containing protein [Nakamurella antarctica]|nr:SpoIID/LytB domain-containing protein [Nakamurella antarctica]